MGRIITDLFGNEVVEPVHYLTWHQPFASLMLHRKLETRGKPTKVRGRVLILSSQKPYDKGWLFEQCGPKIMSAIISTLKNEPTRDTTAHAIAIGNLVGCRLMTKKDEGLAFIKYKPGKWIWEFENVQRIVPFDFKGKQGWGTIDNPLVLDKIKVTA